MNLIGTHFKAIQHVGIPTSNIEDSIAFYKKLGFEVEYETTFEGNRVAFMLAKGIKIELYESDEASHMVGAIDHIAIDVDDIEVVYSLVNDIGLNNLDDSINFLPFYENGVSYFTIEGPNKERIEFNQKH